MTILSPHQPITTDGRKPSRELLEALQASGRDAKGMSASIEAITDQIAAIQAELNDTAALDHDHVAADISDSTAAGRAMLTAANVAAQTALLNAYSGSAKGLVPAFTAPGLFLRSDGAWATGFEYGFLPADYLLTNSTASQRLFNWSANGALTLATGVYRFRALFQITGMSATSGNAAFSLLGAGTATIGRVMYHASGVDSTTPLTAAGRTGSASVTVASVASVVTAGTGTGMLAEITGLFDVSTAGTVIPSIALVTAAAATVKAGSFFECQRVGDTGVAASGGWS